MNSHVLSFFLFFFFPSSSIIGGLRELEQKFISLLKSILFLARSANFLQMRKPFIRSLNERENRRDYFLNSRTGRQSNSCNELHAFKNETTLCVRDISNRTLWLISRFFREIKNTRSSNGKRRNPLRKNVKSIRRMEKGVKPLHKGKCFIRYHNI